MATTTAIPRNKVLSVMLNLLSYKKSEKNGNEKQVQQVSGVPYLLEWYYPFINAYCFHSQYILLLHLCCIIQVSSGVVVQGHDDSGSSYLVSA